MCQVHTDAYVSLLTPGEPDFIRLPPEKDYHVYITRTDYSMLDAWRIAPDVVFQALGASPCPSSPSSPSSPGC